MAQRFVCLIGFGEPAGRRCAELASAAKCDGLVQRFSAQGLMVLAAGEMAFRPIGLEDGVVLGQLFERRAGFPDAASRLSAGALGDGGASFLQRYWGRYVGIGRMGQADGGWVVLRDPSGGIPVYYFRSAGVMAFVSDLPLARALGFSPHEVSWTFVEQHLAYPELRLARTGLSGMTELLSGGAAEVSASGVRVNPAWTPRGYAKACRRSFAEASAEVSAVVGDCTLALARGRRSVAVQLSGGLDSSIVAGCVSSSASSAKFINLVAPGRDGDERRYARAMADRCGRPLHEIELAPQPVVIASSDAGLHPGPPMLFAGINSALAEAGAALGAEAMFTGGGGDNVFAHLASAAPAADRLLAKGGGRDFWRTLADIAEVNHATIWSTAAKALHILAAPPPVWPRRKGFMHPRWRPAPAPKHPWLEGARWDSPGCGERIHAILRLQNLVDPALRPSPLDVVHPLLAQPVLETCLSISSWLWVEGGVDRAVARHAFRAHLPDLIIQRRSKGSLHGYFTGVYMQSRHILGELLTDGLLARRGLIDGVAVRTYLERGDRPGDPGFYRLFELADLEAWLRASTFS